MPPELSCEILTSEAQIRSISDEWHELQARIGQTPFTDYDWIEIWWRELGSRHKWHLHIVTGRIDGKLAAILPLAVQHEKGLNILRAAGHKAFHYCDALCKDELHAVELWKAAKVSPYYDFADIRDVYPESPCYDALKSFAQRRDETEAFMLRLNWSNSDEWRASLSKDMRGKAKRCMKRLEEKGPVTFEICQKGPVPKDIIDAMVRQKSHWSRSNNKSGLFHQSGIAPYFEQLVENAARQNRLMLMWLKCGDQTIAYNLGFIYQNALHGYVITHDPAWSAYGPGILMIMRSIEWSIEKKLAAVDHRQGDGSYKSRFSNEKRRCAEFTFSGSLRGQILERVFIFLRSIRRMLPKISNSPHKATQPAGLSA